MVLQQIFTESDYLQQQKRSSLILIRNKIKRKFF